MTLSVSGKTTLATVGPGAVTSVGGTRRRFEVDKIPNIRRQGAGERSDRKISGRQVVERGAIGGVNGGNIRQAHRARHTADAIDVNEGIRLIKRNEAAIVAE